MLIDNNTIDITFTVREENTILDFKCWFIWQNNKSARFIRNIGVQEYFSQFSLSAVTIFDSKSPYRLENNSLTADSNILLKRVSFESKMLWNWPFKQLF